MCVTNLPWSMIRLSIFPTTAHTHAPMTRDNADSVLITASSRNADELTCRSPSANATVFQVWDQGHVLAIVYNVSHMKWSVSVVGYAST
jgi:hypothetical protein